MNQIFDLTVKVKLEVLTRPSKEIGEALAYVAGVLSGLRVGYARLRCSDVKPPPNTDLVKIAGDGSLPVDDAVIKINSLMPVGTFCTKNHFIRPEFRGNPEFKRGFIDGFYYVYYLYSVFDEAGMKRDTATKAVKEICDSRETEIYAYVY